MKLRKISIIILALLLVFASFMGCSKTQNDNEPTPSPDASIEPTSNPEDRSFTLTDMTGREIFFDEPATRVVVLTAADCEILYAIGAGDVVVGRGEYCDYPTEALDVVSVQSGSETNIEQIVALNPQVVLMSTMDQTVEQVSALEDTGIKVVVSNANDINGVYTDIEMIGKLTGRETEAASVINNMQTEFAELSANALDGTKTVYFEVSPLEWGLWTAGSGTFMNEICEMLGLKNAFSDVEGWAEISEEQVLERNPDYIVTIAMYFGEGPTPEEEIMSRQGWENVTAVKNSAILNLQNNELSRPSPRLVDGAKQLFELIGK